jgi:hypothetical protein
LAMCRKLFGNEDPQVANCLDHLAASLQQQHKLTEAEATARESLAMYRKLLATSVRKRSARLFDWHMCWPTKAGLPSGSGLSRGGCHPKKVARKRASARG